MKLSSKFFALLILAALPFSGLAQNATIVLNYMDVTPGMEWQYVNVEKEWKKLHKKNIEAGMMTGWQLWKNVYAGADDPYQYITINWYKNLAQSLAPNPEAYWNDMVVPLFTEEEREKNWEMTLKSRRLAHKEVLHRAMQAEGSIGSKYIVVNRMKVKEGNGDAYLESEGTYSKPLQEEKIKEDLLAHWSVWIAWPYSQGQIRYSTVDGYSSLEQLNAGGGDLLEKVHPGMTWEEWAEKVTEHRIQSSIEIWELVDSVFPESAEE